MIKKLFWFIFALLFLFSNFLLAENYIFYYGDGCPHCANVEKFFDKNDVIENYTVDMKEVYKNDLNREEFLKECGQLWIPIQEQWVPMLLITSWDERSCLIWDDDIISHFENKNIVNQTWNILDTTGSSISWTLETPVSDKERRAFFGIMLPAAISDSINPCAFTVMLLLLTSILAKSKSRKKAIFSWLLFSLAIFLSYYLMWLWFFSALATAKSVTVIKIVFWSLWILVWLANLKDFFRYGKWFVMEVPFSRRPKLKSIIDKVSSPIGAFLVWFLVSLFLLPCSSGPYITILGYLASKSKDLHLRWYIYLTVYNLIFIVPMVLITLLIWFGLKSVEQLAKLKTKNTKLIHLIVGLLMLGLWIYVLLS